MSQIPFHNFQSNILPSDSDKKIQQSWGGADGNTELKNEEQASVDAVIESSNEWAADSAPVTDWGTPAATTEADAPGTTEADKPEGRPRREREPEEEDNTLTLEQYLAQQKDKESVIPKLEGTRPANEGADTNIWKDVVPLQKEEGDAYFVGKVKLFLPLYKIPSQLFDPRASQLPRFAPRKMKRSSLKLMHDSIVPTVVAVAVVVVAVTGATEDVVVSVDAVDLGVAGSPTPLPSMLMIKLPSRPCLEIMSIRHVISG